MIDSIISKGLLAMTTLGVVSCTASTLSMEDWDKVSEIRARQSGKSYLASWTKSTISVPGGIEGSPPAQNINTRGFTIWNEVNDVVYENGTPGGYQPCVANSDKQGRQFTLGGACFAPWDFKFQCKSQFSGAPDWCQVFDIGMNDLGWNYGDAAIDFYGAFITSSGSCAVVFPVPEEMSCGANEPLEVSNVHVVDS